MLTAMDRPLETTDQISSELAFRREGAWLSEDVENKGTSIWEYAFDLVAATDPMVTPLVCGDCDMDQDEVDGVISQLQSRLRAGDFIAAHALAHAAKDVTIEPSCRAMALDALVAPRLRFLEYLTVPAVRRAIKASDSVLQFAGVAAAAALSPVSRQSLLGLIKDLPTTSTDPAVQSAANAFIERYA